ncbi:MAG: CubicO group peptidase (beta-lactamase class C family) [Vicingaceae bacterium]|jgi:CubicO group peptidase (beta-lactamase class C family)
MNLLRKTLSVVLLLLVVAVLGLYFSGNIHLLKAIKSTYLVGKTGPTIDDYQKFVNRTVEAKKPQPLINYPKSTEIKLTLEEEELFEKWETSSFVILKGGKVFFEKYWDAYTDKSLTNSFSMAKSFTSLCIGAAIKDGKIESTNQLISDFLPEYKGSGISIKDLLQMSSGIDFGESYGDPFGFMAKAYYGKDVYDLTLSKKSAKPPGVEWKYQGGNTLLLSFIIQKATGKTLSNYFAEKFWQPLGAESNALWTIDKEEGRERAYCCFYSNAKDYARIGQLILDSGRWNENQLIDLEYFVSSVSPVNLPDEFGKEVSYYGYQWWLGEYNDISFHYARGILGQYIVAVPQWDLVFLRLGKKRDPTRNAIIPSDLLEYFEIVERIKEV